MQRERVRWHSRRGGSGTVFGTAKGQFNKVPTTTAAKWAETRVKVLRENKKGKMENKPEQRMQKKIK